MRQIVILTLTIALLFAAAVEGQYSRQVCRPNSVFKVDCNTCRCSTDGINMACTKQACFSSYGGSSEPLRVNKKKAQMCEPGTYFKMDCNDCRCNEDGTNAACTLKACPRY